MKIECFPNGVLWFYFPDEEMYWDYILNEGWVCSGVLLNKGNEDFLYSKEVEELKWK